MMKRFSGNILTALLLCITGSNAVVPASAQARIDSSFQLEFVHSPLPNMQTIRIEGIQNIIMTPDGKMLIRQWGVVRDYFGQQIELYNGFFRYNQDGSLDRNLNDSGYVRWPAPGWLEALFFRQDGTFFSSLSLKPCIGVRRFKPDLQLDSSFGTDGSTWNCTDSIEGASAPTFDNSGRMVAGIQPFGVLRLTAKGYLDSSFGVNSQTRLDVGEYAYGVNAVKVLPNGKILFAGEGYPNHQIAFTLGRMFDNGKLDSSFGSDGTGIVYTPFGTRYDVVHDMVIQPDGKIVLAGQAGYDAIAMARYLPNGTLDTSFNHTGTLIADNGGLRLKGDQLILMPNGKMLVGCRAYDASGSDKHKNLAVFRCNSDGTPDTTFAPHGVFMVDFGYDDEFGGIALQPNGGILLYGNSEDNTDPYNPIYYRDLVRLMVKEKETPPIDAPFVISPNPFASSIHVQAPAAGTLRFVDAIGRLIGTYPVPIGQSDLAPSFAPGFYIWSFISENGSRQTGTIIHR